MQSWLQGRITEKRLNSSKIYEMFDVAIEMMELESGNGCITDDCCHSPSALKAQPTQ